MHMTQYTREELNREASLAAKEIRKETGHPAKVKGWSICLDGSNTCLKVLVLAYANGEIRRVEIPQAEITKLVNAEVTGERFHSAMLELAFSFGQNEKQSKPMPSVSVGDVIRYEGRRWLVKNCGFSNVTSDWTPPRDAEGRLREWLIV